MGPGLTFGAVFLLTIHDPDNLTLLQGVTFFGGIGLGIGWFLATGELIRKSHEARLWLVRKVSAVRTVEAWHGERQRVRQEREAQRAADLVLEEARRQAEAAKLARLSEEFIVAAEAFLEATGLNALEATVEAARLRDQYTGRRSK